MATKEGLKAALLLSVIIGRGIGGRIDDGGEGVGSVKTAAPEEEGGVEGIGVAIVKEPPSDGTGGVDGELGRGEWAGGDELVHVGEGDGPAHGGGRAEQEDGEGRTLTPGQRPPLPPGRRPVQAVIREHDPPHLVPGNVDDDPRNPKSENWCVSTRASASERERERSRRKEMYGGAEEVGFRIRWCLD